MLRGVCVGPGIRGDPLGPGAAQAMRVDGQDRQEQRGDQPDRAERAVQDREASGPGSSGDDRARDGLRTDGVSTAGHAPTPCVTVGRRERRDALRA